jgi:hypothetical protein
MDVMTSHSNRKDVMPCNVCGKPSQLLVSVPSFALDAISGDFPGATNKFEADHIRRANKERKQNS